MTDDLDPATKLEVYKLVLARYKDLISEKESRSISEIRQRVSPYGDFIKKLNSQMLNDIIPYDPRLHFMMAAERALDHVRKIQTCEFSFTFWMDFKEIEALKLATAMDKSILLAALLRSFGSEDVRVLVSKKGKSFVRFSFKATEHVFISETGSLLIGDDAMKVFSDDPISYSFNDLVYENYEDQ